MTLRYREIFGAGRRVFGVMGPSELHSTGDTFEDVLRSLGHTVVKMWPRSPVVGTDRALLLIGEPGGKALVYTPAVAAELLKLATVSLRAWGLVLLPITVAVLAAVGSVFILGALSLRRLLSTPGALRVLYRGAALIMGMAALLMLVTG